MSPHATLLIKQVTNPTKKDHLTPQVLNVHGVTNTFMIYPISGKIKTTPAYLPIHEEAMLPCII